MSLESIMLDLSTGFLVLALVFYLWRWTAGRPLKGNLKAGDAAALETRRSSRRPDYFNLAMLVGGWLSLTISLAARAITTGHGPFSNMYEFAVAFAWGVLVMGFYFRWRYKVALIGAIGNIIALGLLIIARYLPSQSDPLVPALQQSLLLTAHVASAVISYGAFSVGFASALLFMIKSRDAGLSEMLDEISYQTVIIGFPFMTLLIILGALWADVAWGKYWSWDPKETASLVTWLFYASYLHARVIRGWRGKRAAVLLILGFAAVLVTFFGNYIFSGLHSY
jgi:ABC-type transport system involved in cytochrome c biogenesis permease subunit